MALFVYPPSTVSIPGAATEATLLDVLAEVTDINNLGAKEAKQDAEITELQAINTATSNLDARVAAALVPEAHDYLDITYVGSTTRIDTVVYKQGGSGGTTVATLTMAYDGNDRLTSVTKS